MSNSASNSVSYECVTARSKRSRGGSTSAVEEPDVEWLAQDEFDLTETFVALSKLVARILLTKTRRSGATRGALDVSICQRLTPLTRRRSMVDNLAEEAAKAALSAQS